MIVGMVFQKTSAKAQETIYTYAVPTIAKIDETMEELAGRMEQQAEQARRQYPTYQYRTLVGELTHEIEPPKPIVVKVKPLRKVKGE